MSMRISSALAQTAVSLVKTIPKLWMLPVALRIISEIPVARADREGLAIDDAREYGIGRLNGCISVCRQQNTGFNLDQCIRRCWATHIGGL